MTKRPAAVSDRHRLTYGGICGKMAAIFVPECADFKQFQPIFGR